MTPRPDDGRRRLRRSGRRTGAAAITALVTSAAVALLGWAGPTYATTGTAGARPTAGAVSAPAHPAPAVTLRRPGHPASASPGAGGRRPAASPPAKPSGPTSSGPKQTAQKPSAAKPSAAQLKALRAKAAAGALASASPANSQDTACGGPLAFDTVHACDAIPDGGSDTYTLTTSAADDLLTIQLAGTSGYVDGLLTGPDGGITCRADISQAETCATGPAGTYTLVVTAQSGAGGYTLAVSSLKSSPCTQLGPDGLAFGTAPLAGSLAAGAASACYALGDGAGSGDVLRLSGAPYELQGTIYDADHTAVCRLQYAPDTCSLTGSAPYRMLLTDTYARAATYTVFVNRVSHPAGCPALAAAPFGDPGTATASGTLPVGGADCRTVTLPDGPTAVSLQGADSTGGSTTWALYTAQGDRACDGTDDATCTTLPGAGTYTLLLQNTSPWTATAYAAALVPLTSTEGCAASVGTSYDLPLLHRTLGSAVQTDCQAFDAQAGDRIDLTAGTDVYGELHSTIVDPSGTPSCSTDTPDGSSQDGCVLTGTGPYRVITRSSYDFTGAYTMRIARLSDPAGCTDLSPQSYGSAPATSTDPCWLLHVPAAGTYDVGGTGVYHLDGTRLCAQDAGSCAFPAPGTYAMVFRPDHLDGSPFAPVFVSPAQTAGCVTASDRGFASGAVSLDLTAAGARDCLLLPTASGNGLYLVPAWSQDGPAPVETVYDTAGVQQCHNEYPFAVCSLTGTAPFHLVATAPVPGTYALAVQRTGDTAGCAAWPQTPFGSAAGTPVALTATSQTACLTIPAGGHSTAEMFDFTNTANRLDAGVRVYDAAGGQVCASLGSSATTCRFTAGVTYTAVLVGTGTVDTYHLVRRDVSASATCAAPASLTLGAASTAYTFTSALDSRCLRVKAATTDKLWLSVRTPAAAAKTGADLLVVDATGAIVCWQQGVACRVSGSASYVVAVLASGYTGTPIAAQVDTWRVATAAGWVPQCTANSLSPDGFAPRGGTLTGTSAAFCGVMQVKPTQLFDVYVVTSGAKIPALGMYSGAGWNGTSLDTPYQCTGAGDGFTYWCSVSGPATQVVVVLSPGSAALPVPYTMQGVCRLPCTTGPKAADVTSVSPSSGPAGADNQVVVHGSNLTLGTDVKLEKNGSQTSDGRQSAPVSVSADGTTLTVRLSTRGLTPGRYDVVLNDTGYTPGTRSTGYLPGGYTVTKALPPRWGGPIHVSEPPWMAAFLRDRRA